MTVWTAVLIVFGSPLLPSLLVTMMLLAGDVLDEWRDCRADKRRTP